MEKEWLIIGSVAAKHWWDDFRNPKDVDILSKKNIKSGYDGVCLIDSGWHETATLILQHNLHPTFADPNILFTLKVSHASWDIKFDKTIFDVMFMKKKGCTLNEELYPKLLIQWENIHGKRNINLNVPNEEFFKEYVKRKIPHDELHEMLKFGEVPYYKQIKTQQDLALCDKALFDALSYQQQLDCALEEIMVIAVERYALSSESSNVKIKIALTGAYKILVTSATGGWFNKFLVLNAYELLNENRTRCANHISQTLKEQNYE